MLSVATKIFVLGVVAFSLQGCGGSGHNNNSTPKNEPVDLPHKDRLKFQKRYNTVNLILTSLF